MAPMEVDPDWPPLPQPGEHNQLNTTMLQFPIIPMHQALGECNTAYPMLPKGFHQSQVDNTVHAGAAAKAAQWNEALGVVPPCNTMRPSNHGFPQMVTDWEGLYKVTCRQGNNKALQITRAFVTQAQNMPGVQHTEPQHQALREWTYPVWFTPAPRKGKEHVVPKTVGHQVATSPGQPLVSTTNLAMTGASAPLLPLFLDLPPPHDDGWQPCHVDEVHLGMPMLWDSPEMSAMWIDQHPDKRPRGIVVMPDGRISMCGICGIQLIKRCNPQPKAIEQQ